MRLFARVAIARLRYGRGIEEFDQYGFSTRSVGEWRTYQHHPDFRPVQERVSPAQYRAYDEDKLLFAAHCRTHDLPTAHPLALLSAPDDPMDETERHGVPVVRSGEVLRAMLGAHTSLHGFAKPIFGGRGYGAFGFSVSDGQVTSADGDETLEAFFTRLTTSRFGHAGYLLQPRLIPHPELAWGMQGVGIGTVRLVTGLQRDGTVAIPMASIKFVPAGAETDKMNAGALSAGVDVRTGAITRARGRIPGERLFQYFERMPPDGERLVGRHVPCWEETLAVVERAARAFPMLPALGWDVAITPDGPVLVETNWMFGVSLMQIGLDRGLQPEMDRLYANLAPASPPATL